MHIDYAWVSAYIILIQSPYCIAIHTILLHSDDSTHTYSYVVNAIISMIVVMNLTEMPLVN